MFLYKSDLLLIVLNEFDRWIIRSYFKNDCLTLRKGRALRILLILLHWECSERENRRRPQRLPFLLLRLDLKVSVASHFVETAFTLEAAEASVFFGHTFA